MPSPTWVGVAFHEPLPCTSVVIVWPAIETVTVVPGMASEVPVIVGVDVVSRRGRPAVDCDRPAIPCRRSSVWVDGRWVPSSVRHLSDDAMRAVGKSGRGHGPCAANLDRSRQRLVGEVHGHFRARRDVRGPGDIRGRVVREPGLPACDQQLAVRAVSTVNAWLSVPGLPAGSADRGGDGVSAVGQRAWSYVPRLLRSARSRTTSVSRLPCGRSFPGLCRLCRKSSGSGRSSSLTARRRG